LRARRLAGARLRAVADFTLRAMRRSVPAADARAGVGTIDARRTAKLDMPRIVRAALFSIRDLAITVGPFVLIALALLVAAYYVLKPNPPRTVVLATGPEQTDFAEFGKRYAQELRKYGIEVKLHATAGSSANRRLLRENKEDVDFGFVRSGTSEIVRVADEEKGEINVFSLGSLFYEAVWIFYREDAARALPGRRLTRLGQLEGWRVNTGSRGAGTRDLVAKVLDANGVEPKEIKESRLEETPAVVALLEGQVDAIVLVAAPESPMVQMLLQTPKIGLFEFPQTEAYARHYPFLTPVTLPRGVADIARDVPPRDLQLLATTVTLAAREDAHPALVQLFVQAAHAIHSKAGWLARKGQFPVAQGSELPLADTADRFYRSGPPLLQRYLPFWLANLIERMWVALFSIVAILIPLSRIVPPLYVLRIRSRLFRSYRALREIEREASERDASAPDLLKRLERLDANAERITVPVSYTDELYALRSAIALVRARLLQQQAA
jgi:TRAP-type uncharacterized transport system substrate-binding protein